MSERRFDVFVENVLREAGWFPDRNIGDTLLLWKKELELSDGFESFPAAEAALAEFGELYVKQQGAGVTCARQSFHLVPTLAVDEKDRFDVFSEALKMKLYPLGEATDGYYFLAIGEDGRVFLVMQDILLVGENIDQALEHLILGIASQAMQDSALNLDSDARD